MKVAGLALYVTKDRSARISTAGFLDPKSKFRPNDHIFAGIFDDRSPLFRYLPRFRRRKQRFNSRSYEDPIKDKIHISKRPKLVEKRSRLGDLEADLIQGYRQSGFILTVVERKSRYVILRKLKDKSAKNVSRELIFAAKKFKSSKTLTTDNGKEFAGHKDIARVSKILFFFATPYASSERGTVENTNGLVRRVYPKKKSFAAISQSDLNRLQKNLNDRPRKVLKFLTPKEVHFKLEKRIPKRCI